MNTKTVDCPHCGKTGKVEIAGIALVRNRTQIILPVKCCGCNRLLVWISPEEVSNTVDFAQALPQKITQVVCLSATERS